MTRRKGKEQEKREALLEDDVLAPKRVVRREKQKNMMDKEMV